MHRDGRASGEPLLWDSDGDNEQDRPVPGGLIVEISRKDEWSHYRLDRVEAAAESRLKQETCGVVALPLVAVRNRSLGKKKKQQIPNIF